MSHDPTLGSDVNGKTKKSAVGPKCKWYISTACFVGLVLLGRDFLTRTIVEETRFNVLWPLCYRDSFLQSDESDFDKCKVRFCISDLMLLIFV
jgi:hypothetical protein